MNVDQLYWLAIAMMAFAHVIAITGFVFYGDVMQYILNPPRRIVLGLLPYRIRLSILALSLMAAGIGIFVYVGHFNPWWLAIQAIVFLGFLYVGFVMISYHCFNTDYETKFVDVSRAEADLDSKDKINVLVVGDEARGYPTKYMLQPHFASSTIATEDVAMTYCGLSNLGVAFSPRNKGKKLQLRTVGQLNNNVIFFDVKSGEYYQQIFGGNEDHSRKFDKQFPTRAMSWKSFKAIYPNALVYSNPPKNVLDHLVRAMIGWALREQEGKFRAHFPTIDHNADQRLHPKQYVAGLILEGQAVAFTKRFLSENNCIFNTVQGGVPIAVVLYNEFDFVDIYDRRVDGEAVEVTDIDVHGVLPTGHILDRLPFFPEVHWMIWHHHYPETQLHKSDVEGSFYRSDRRDINYMGDESAA